MDSSENKLRSRPISALLLSLSLPMIVSMLINSLYNIIDSIYVSRLGTQAVTALSIIFPLQNLTIAVSVGLGIGITSLVSRNMGARKLGEAEHAASVGMGLALLHAVIFFIIGAFFIDDYLEIYGVSGETYAWSLGYGRIVLCFSLPYLFYLALEKIFQSIGWMKTAMFGMLIGAVTNIILDPIMIFGTLGFPALGVSGAAIATVCGQFVAFLYFVFIYLFSSFPIRLHFKEFLPQWPYVRDLYVVAIPAALTLGLPSVLVGILNTILINYSEISVAVLGLYYKIQTFFYMPVSGLGQGMRPILSYNYGAREYGRVKETAKLSILVSICILALGTFILFFFPDQVMNLFDPEPGLRESGAQAFRIISTGFIPSAFSVIGNGIFEAFGLGFDSLIVSLTRQVIVMIPAAYILSALFGAVGVWSAFPVSETVSAILSLILLIRVFRKLGVNDEYT